MAQLLKYRFTNEFSKQYKRLPSSIQKKFTKQLKYLLENPQHPSLHIKKMIGLSRLEARVDYHYRFTFEQYKDSIILRTIGPHDEGLGKK